jgi:hypothetical protein
MMKEEEDITNPTLDIIFSISDITPPHRLSQMSLNSTQRCSLRPSPDRLSFRATRKPVETE